MATIDIELVQRDTYLDIDFDEIGALKTTDSLDTTVMVSLFEDARANPEQAFLPEHRRGSWVNILNSVQGFVRGSLLWLLAQARLTTDTVNKAKDYTERSLQPLIDDDVIERFEVEAFRRDGKLEIIIKLFDGLGVSEVRFPDALNNMSLIFNEI